MRVELGSRLSIEYAVYLEDGQRVDGNAGQPPLELICGLSEVMPAQVELAMVGLEPGQGRRITLEPERAYGPVIPEAIREVDPAFVPEEAHRVGAALIAEDGHGGRKVSRVVAIRDDGRLVIDHNHPLAGRTLTFEVRVVEILPREARP